VLVLALPHWVVNGTSDAPWAQLEKKHIDAGLSWLSFGYCGRSPGSISSFRSDVTRSIKLHS
jgi:hypothetical protein